MRADAWKPLFTSSRRQSDLGIDVADFWLFVRMLRDRMPMPLGRRGVVSSTAKERERRVSRERLVSATARNQKL